MDRIQYALGGCDASDKEDLNSNMDRIQLHPKRAAFLIFIDLNSNMDRIQLSQVVAIAKSGLKFKFQYG